jgi:hypothetical protein
VLGLPLVPVGALDVVAEDEASHRQALGEWHLERKPLGLPVTGQTRQRLVLAL